MTDRTLIASLMRFSGSGSPKLKIVLLGDVLVEVPELLSVFRSLNCEHIALGAAPDVPDLGVPRNILAPSTPRPAAVEALRRWFFRRKPDAGFVLTGFPACLSEAGLLDEWLEDRGEILDVCLFPQSDATDSARTLRRHYQLHGSAWTSGCAAPLPEWLVAAPTP